MREGSVSAGQVRGPGMKTPLLRHFVVKLIVLLRQARDKQRENTQKTRCVFLQLLSASRIVVTMPGYGHSGSFRLNVDETLGASEDEVNRENMPCVSSDETLQFTDEKAMVCQPEL